MRFVSIILSSLALATQILATLSPEPPVNEVADPPVNEVASPTLPIPAGKVQARNPLPTVPVVDLNCDGAVLHPWPLVRALFYPRLERQVTVDWRAAQRRPLGWDHHFWNERGAPFHTDILVRVYITVWHPDTGTLAVGIEAHNRLDTIRSVSLNVEVSPPFGHQGAMNVYRRTLRMNGNGLAPTDCLVNKFGPHATIKMILWLED